MSRSFGPLTLHRLGVLVSTLTACLVALVAITAPPAFAAMVGCRTDPIIVMEGGKILRVVVRAEAPASEVHSIHYILHLAPSEKVKRVIYTGVLKDKESLEIRYDGVPDTYAVETYLSGASDFGVTVTASMRGDRVSVTGRSNQVLPLVLER